MTLEQLLAAKVGLAQLVNSNLAHARLWSVETA